MFPRAKAHGSMNAQSGPEGASVLCSHPDVPGWEQRIGYDNKALKEAGV
jgi:hypothetical protein